MDMTTVRGVFRETNLLVTLYERLLLFDFFINLSELLLCNRVSGLGPSLLLTGFFCTSQLSRERKQPKQSQIKEFTTNHLALCHQCGFK